MSGRIAIAPAVRDVLSAASVAGTAERPVVVLNSPQLERSLYASVDKVLKALGGKWDRRAGGHVFSRPVEGELAEALHSGVAVDAGRAAEQFFTPPEIAQRVVALAQLGRESVVLEPSAGAGALIRAVAEASPTTIIDAVERDEGLVADLKKSFGLRASVYSANFTMWEPTRRYDRVVMNPPFSRGQDIDHVCRALSFVRPGGRLVAIMSPHWTFAPDARSVRFRANLQQLDHSWTPLPDGAFKSSGTNVSTGILVVKDLAA